MTGARTSKGPQGLEPGASPVEPPARGSAAQNGGARAGGSIHFHVRWWTALSPLVVAGILAWALGPRHADRAPRGAAPPPTPPVVEAAEEAPAGAPAAQPSAVRPAPRLPPVAGPPPAPRRAPVDPTTLSPDELDALSNGPSRAPAKQDSRRRYREDLRQIARMDRAEFARTVQERVEAPDATLEEKTGAILAALDEDRAVAESLIAYAIDIDRCRDERLRYAVGTLLLRLAPRDALARERLQSAVVLEPRASLEMRTSAATAVLAAATEERVGDLLRAAERTGERAVYMAAIRGLARNPAPRAQELRDEIARTYDFDPDAKAAAAEAPTEAPRIRDRDHDGGE